MKNICVLLACILLCPLYAMSHETPTQLARQVVDQLMNIDNAQAKLSIEHLNQQYPDYPLLSFVKIMPMWAQAEATYDVALRQQRWQSTLDTLLHNIALIENRVNQHPNEALWQLNLGLSQAFCGLLHMRLGNWLDAYHYGRAGRDMLRITIQQHPKLEDAYFVPGFYEYYTGNVPFYLAWLTWLIDLSGDKDVGLQYIHRAIQHAPIFSPEAARLLLSQTETTHDNACQRKALAKSMITTYPNNELFPWLAKQFELQCKRVAKAN